MGSPFDIICLILHGFTVLVSLLRNFGKAIIGKSLSGKPLDMLPIAHSPQITCSFTNIGWPVSVSHPGSTDGMAGISWIKPPHWKKTNLSNVWLEVFHKRLTLPKLYSVAVLHSHCCMYFAACSSVFQFHCSKSKLSMWSMVQWQVEDQLFQNHEDIYMTSPSRMSHTLVIWMLSWLPAAAQLFSYQTILLFVPKYQKSIPATHTL